MVLEIHWGEHFGVFVGIGIVFWRVFVGGIG